MDNSSIKRALSGWDIPELNLTPNFWAVAVAMEAGYGIVSLEGGARSGKTYAALQWIVLASLSPKTFIPDFPDDKLVTRCLRREAANARDSIFKDLNEILATLGIFHGERGFLLNKTTMTWTFPNGSEIMCGGSSDKDKLHGLKQDIVFFNEVMQIPKASFDQANLRTRRAFILDWNPSLNDHWVFKEGLDKTCNYSKEEGEDLEGKPKCCYFHSTYKDNYNTQSPQKQSNLTKRQVAAIEEYEPTPTNIANGKANKFMWDVYGLGKRGLLEGRVIPAERVVVVNPSEFPTDKQWELHGYGLDWGYVDPLAFVECAIWNKKFYVRQLIYQTGLTVSPPPTDPTQESVLGKLKHMGISNSEAIVVDSARRDLSDALRSAGYMIIPADKVAGSIQNGINLMNSRLWCVTSDSTMVLKELENYVWGTTRTGAFISKPIDKWNHAIDACRYWLTTFLTASNDSIYAAEGTEEEDSVEYGCEMQDYFM